MSFKFSNRGLLIQSLIAEEEKSKRKTERGLEITEIKIDTKREKT